MSHYVQTSVHNHIAYITLDRPKALNSLSLEMIRALTHALQQWRDDAEVHAVFIRGSEERAFCAGGDIRFFYDVGTATPQGDSALLEDFFTEEYALNHLIHFYPKPYIAWMSGVVMGGGMGIAQAGENCRLRIVTERTKMAMPEVNIGLFPDVGGGYFLSRCEGQIGTYLGLSGEIINAADAMYAELADVYIPSTALPQLLKMLGDTDSKNVPQAIHAFATQFSAQAGTSKLAQQRHQIDQHFAADSLPEIIASLQQDSNEFAQQTLASMNKRSPLLMAVTLEQLRRGAHLSVAQCLRMERDMVRHCFKHGEVLEGVRALVVDKDNAPKWSPASIAEVSAEQVASFFVSPWPAYAHPLYHLK